MTARYNGDVKWDGLVIFSSFCKIDFSFFPYDEQKCELILRAWSYSAKKVVLRPGKCLEVRVMKMQYIYIINDFIYYKAGVNPNIMK